MRLSTLAFEPERARIVTFGLICVILSIGHASENLILGGGVAAAKAGEVRPDLAVAIVLNGIVYVTAITAFSWRMSSNVLRAAMRGRRRLLDALLGHDLATLERIDRDRLLHGLTGAAMALTSHGPILVRITESIFVAVGALAVLSLMSLPLLLVVAGMLSLVAFGMAINHRPIMGAYADANRCDAESHSDLVALVDGFKELKQNADRRQRFLLDLRTRSLLARRTRARANRQLTFSLLLQGGAIMSTCGLFVFVLPHVLPELGHGTLIAATLMIANMPLMTVRDTPLLARGEAVVVEMETLYAAFGPPTASEPVMDQPEFASVALDAVSYRYDQCDGVDGGGEGFMLGPVSLQCPAGSITFIVGGNGSGKSTLMKLLAGLYAPSGGRTLLNGQPAPLSVLREASSTIFADLHLFDRLYGMQDADPVAINAAIADMGIGGSTRLVNGAFTNISLSSGQRKRLAWVVAMQEARPLLLLDEWAADQDPEFRDRFYRVLLPGLRAAGRTVVAVSHDDRYFDVADQVVRLEFGRIRQG